MEIKTIPVGYLQANCYIISDKDNCIIIDPGDEHQKIINEIGSLKPLVILITHDHFDHVGAVSEIRKHYNISVYEKENLEEKDYKIGDFNFEVIFTPGHADTCVTYYFKKEKVMFTGDFLFKECIGRTDLDTSCEHDMINSIEKIKTYSNDIIIYPGHGTNSTLGYEKQYNYFLN